MDAKEIRLEAVKIAAEKLYPNADHNGLLANAEEIYLFVTNGTRRPHCPEKS